ncbi:MAG: sigma-70 family RNA polymerase sigma factor [Muribaculaceae bacterium]|nr:sigma-70 family RNA polymerase sigma factor [Muribaculaceae bacterium]
MKKEYTLDFERLVMEHKSTIYSVCYMFTDTKPEADDLFQEVLISLWQGLDSFRGDASIRSWVYRVSMNTCISYKRKKKLPTVSLDFSPDAIAPDSPGSKQARMLHDRIAALEPFDRAIVLLWLEDMSYDEIASIVGISAKAVGVRLVRIKEKLKSMV